MANNVQEQLDSFPISCYHFASYANYLIIRLRFANFHLIRESRFPVAFLILNIFPNFPDFLIKKDP